MKVFGKGLSALLLNILFNSAGLLPALVLLILHFAVDISIWWAVGFAIGYFFWIVLLTLFMNRVSKDAVKEKDRPKKENKNPYSKKGLQ